MDRTIGRCNDVLVANEIDSAFDYATANGEALVAYYDHPFDDMESNFHTYYNAIKSKADSVAIPFRFATAIKSARWYWDWTDSTAPSYNFSNYGSDSLEIKVTDVSPLFNLYAVCMDTSADPDTVARLATNEVTADSVWRIDITGNPVYNGWVIFAITDTCGNWVVDSFECVASEYKIVEIYWNTNFHNIFKPDSTMTIYGENPIH